MDWTKRGFYVPYELESSTGFTEHMPRPSTHVHRQREGVFRALSSTRTL
jgi:hypothetical protein